VRAKHSKAVNTGECEFNFNRAQTANETEPLKQPKRITSRE
jgi:hypothetical protein